MARRGSILAALSLLACAPDATAVDDGAVTLGTSEDDVGETASTGETGETADTGDTATGSDETGEPEVCACAPGTDLIYLSSKFGEIWTYDPLTDVFAEVGQVTCGSGLVYSMAVDHEGRGWILDLDSRDLIRIDLANPLDCTEPPWVPGNGGFTYFGMGFVGDDTLDGCETLYLHSYSGDGPFAEGPGIGRLAAYDPLDGSLTLLADIDYDGGEIDGTSDGRLFAFAGADPSKLIEYDRRSGAVIETLPLPDLPKTSASAFAFHSGDFYFFTEAVPPGCEPCLDACTPAYQECLADPDCAASLQCALDLGQVDDECGGLAPQAVHDCLANTCLDACFPVGGKPSQVTRLDWDQSDGQGKVLTVVNPMAPIRVVGAGTSICAPLEVP